VLDGYKPKLSSPDSFSVDALIPGVWYVRWRQRWNGGWLDGHEASFLRYPMSLLQERVMMAKRFRGPLMTTALSLFSGGTFGICAVIRNCCQAGNFKKSLAPF
jgi:hypothetical protein